MTAYCVDFDGARATVVLRPSWLGRLLGAETRSLDLYRIQGNWFTVGTGRSVDHLTHREIIRDALDYRAVGDVPRWLALEEAK